MWWWKKRKKKRAVAARWEREENSEKGARWGERLEEEEEEVGFERGEKRRGRMLGGGGRGKTRLRPRWGKKKTSDQSSAELSCRTFSEISFFLFFVWIYLLMRGRFLNENALKLAVAAPARLLCVTALVRSLHTRPARNARFSTENIIKFSARFGILFNCRF